MTAQIPLTSFNCSSLREAIYTLAPFWAKPCAIIFPIPEDPPVTRTGRQSEPVILDPLVRTDFSTDIEKCRKIQAWMAVMNSNLILQKKHHRTYGGHFKSRLVLSDKKPVYNGPGARLGVPRLLFTCDSTTSTTGLTRLSWLSLISSGIILQVLLL